MAACSTYSWQREGVIYDKLIKLERRLNHFKSSGINSFPDAQETLSGIDKTLYEVKDLLSNRFWISIANQNIGVVRQEEAPQKLILSMQGTTQKFALAQAVSIRRNFGNLKHLLEQD